MNIIDVSKEIVDSLFPDETWTEPYKNIFVAGSRQPKNSEQKKVFSKEYDMAKLASDITVKRIKQILSGVLKEKNNTGKVYCYVSRLDVLYSWNMQNLKQNKAPDGAISLPQAEINQNSDTHNLTCKKADVNKKNGAVE